jgi:hypothetical protein
VAFVITVAIVAGPLSIDGRRWLYISFRRRALIRHPRSRHTVAASYRRQAKDFEQWKRGDTKDVAALMKPNDDDTLQWWPVSKRVNSSRAEDDDPTLTEIEKQRCNVRRNFGSRGFFCA